MKNLNKLAAVCVVLAVSACGGSTTNAEKLVRLGNTAADINDNIINDGNELRLRDLPATGAASYSGAFFTFGGTGEIYAAENDALDVRVLFVGEVDVDIDFETDLLSGVAGNFIEVANPGYFNVDDTDLIAGDAVTGTLDISGVLRTSVDATFDLRASGKLSGSQGAYLEFVDTSGKADVYGQNADALEIVGGVGGAEVLFDGVDGYVAYSGVAQK